MPNASAPIAPCVEVCESPQTIVVPGRLMPSSGPMMCTMPWRTSRIGMYGTPNSTTFFSSVWTWMRLSSSLMSDGVRAPTVGMLWSATAMVQIRPAQLAAGHAQALERLRAGHLVQQMPVDVEDARPVREPLHDVAVPDLVEQRARLRFGHGVSSLVRRPGDQSAASVSFVAAGASPAAAPVVRARSAMRARLPRAATQIIQLGTAHVAAAHHGDLGDQRRVEREHALHALAVADLAHGEVAVQPLVGTRDAHALEGLGAGALALDHLHRDAHRVARHEVGHRRGSRSGGRSARPRNAG